LLCVFPRYAPSFGSFEFSYPLTDGVRAFMPPQGLLVIAAAAPRTWQIRFIDENIDPATAEDFAWADVVFVSGMHVQRPQMQDILRRAHALDRTVVLGGSSVSACPEHYPDFDYLHVGEMGDATDELFKRLERDVTRPERQVVLTTRERRALTEFPVPAYELAQLSRYFIGSIQFSSGCPYQCEFCDIIEIYGRVPRTKSNEQMLAELDALKDAGWRGMVFIVDDNFIGNKKNVRLFMPDLIDWSTKSGNPFSYITEASVNLAEDDTLLQQMEDAGFRRVFLGIETPVEDSLKEAQKGQNTRRDLLESVHKIQSYGMEVMAGFIVGFDSDPEDIFELQMKFIRESAIPLAMVGLLTALPDTQLWRRLEKEGRLLEVSSGNNTDCSINFVPKMDTTRLVEGYKSILRNIYGPREYYQRALDCLSRFHQNRIEPRKTSLLEDLKAFFKIVMTLGIRDSERAAFWNYLYRVIRFYPRDFAHGLTLAAMGYHFRQITEKYCD